MPGVELGLVPAKLAGMLGNKLALGIHLESVGEDPSGDMTMGGTAIDTVVEVNEAGTVNAQFTLHIAIEALAKGAGWPAPVRSTDTPFGTGRPDGGVSVQPEPTRQMIDGFVRPCSRACTGG
jgi:hypothetical protein